MPNTISKALLDLEIALFRLRLLADRETFSEKRKVEKAIKLMEQAYRILKEAESNL